MFTFRAVTELASRLNFLSYVNFTTEISGCTAAARAKMSHIAVASGNSMQARSYSDQKRQQPAMLFRQLFEHKSFTYTYLLACMKTKEAVLIDPVIEMVARDAKIISQLGLTLKYAINTHVHADHITGSGKLKEVFQGCRSVLGEDSGAKADIYLTDQEKLTVGDIVLEARKTPGHTNGCTSYIHHDGEQAFTGDAVLIRGCGRTDFQQGDPSRLYNSVHRQIFSLPDHYRLYPAHDYTGQPWTTVGEEKMFNPRLSKTEPEFIEIMNNLNLPYPKQIDRALPANLMCGIFDEADLPPPK